MLRSLCEKEIAPYAADVDEKARYTDEALAALNSSGFSAIHIPEEYGGQGGGLRSRRCIVIEEVARVCASSSLIPICNKLGTMGTADARLRGAQAAGAALDRGGRGHARRTRCSERGGR